MVDRQPPPPPQVPLGAPLRLSAAADALARVTRADVQAADRYWTQHATGLRGLLRDVLGQATQKGVSNDGQTTSKP